MKDHQAREIVSSALSEATQGRMDIGGTTDFDVEIRTIGIDSVTLMEMVGFIEDKIGRSFPDEDLAQLNRLSDVVELIQTVHPG